MEDWESDNIVEQWIRENDDTFMSLPTIECNPHLLISKVRKHYMEYLIKLLAVNYESNHKLHNKNVYLPSAIWRCAKMIEMSAAQASMVVQLYRKNISNIVKDVKSNTQERLLYNKLYDCLYHTPENEKKTQTTVDKMNDCKCKCSCNQKKIKKLCNPPKNMYKNISTNNISNVCKSLDQNINSTTLTALSEIQSDTIPNTNCDTSLLKLNEKATEALQNSDELMQQLEKLFQDDPNDDDLFDGALGEADNTPVIKENKRTGDVTSNPESILYSQNEDLNYKEPQKKCLDERLALLSGILVCNTENSQDSGKNQSKKSRPSKWLCEEYFQKVKLFELLDQIRDSDRNKLLRIKAMLVELFGEDSDDEEVVSPLEESPEFVISCKERITPWVVKILTPYYVNGRIRGKALFKSLAKHLISLIYQCSKYPYEYEVKSFIHDFLKSHKMIRCEADFKEFKIENV